VDFRLEDGPLIPIFVSDQMYRETSKLQLPNTYLQLHEEFGTVLLLIRRTFDERPAHERINIWKMVVRVVGGECRWSGIEGNLVRTCKGRYRVPQRVATGTATRCSLPHRLEPAASKAKVLINDKKF
jgi:hypothetical protein